jgi:hypothetical protein
VTRGCRQAAGWGWQASSPAPPSCRAAPPRAQMAAATTRSPRPPAQCHTGCTTSSVTCPTCAALPDFGLCAGAYVCVCACMCVYVCAYHLAHVCWTSRRVDSGPAQGHWVRLSSSPGLECGTCTGRRASAGRQTAGVVWTAVSQAEWRGEPRPCACADGWNSMRHLLHCANSL